MAAAAAPWTIDSHGIAFLETRNAFPGRGDPACILMTERERRLESQVLLHHVQIRVADTGATDLNQDLAGTRRRLWDVVDPSLATDAEKSDGLHGLSFHLVSRIVPRVSLPPRAAEQFRVDRDDHGVQRHQHLHCCGEHDAPPSHAMPRLEMPTGNTRGGQDWFGAVTVVSDSATRRDVIDGHSPSPSHPWAERQRRQA